MLLVNFQFVHLFHIRFSVATVIHGERSNYSEEANKKYIILRSIVYENFFSVNYSMHWCLLFFGYCVKIVHTEHLNNLCTSVCVCVCCDFVSIDLFEIAMQQLQRYSVSFGKEEGKECFCCYCCCCCCCCCYWKRKKSF